MEDSVKKKKKFSAIWVYGPCLLIAVFIWLAVMKANPPMITAEWRDVPVSLSGAEALQEAGYDCRYETVVKHVVLKGTRENLYRCVQESKLTVSVDLSTVVPDGDSFSATVSGKVFGLKEGVSQAEPISVTIEFTLNKSRVAK